jgi:hypothetical protein
MSFSKAKAIGGACELVQVRKRGESREETAVDAGKFRVFNSQLSRIYCSIFLPAERSEKLEQKQRLQGP